eukprot:tig00000334_g24105.t1
MAEEEDPAEPPPPRAPRGAVYATVRHDAETYRHGGVFNLADHNFRAGAGLYMKAAEMNPGDSEISKGFVRATAHVRRDRNYFDEGLRWWDIEAMGVEDPLEAELRRRRENPNWYEDLEREDAMRAMRSRTIREPDREQEEEEELEIPEVAPDEPDEDFNAMWKAVYLQDLIMKEAVDRRAEALQAHFVSLVKVFRYYSRLMTGGIPRLDNRLRHSAGEPPAPAPAFPSGAVPPESMFTMSKREFEKLMHDCRVAENATMAASINVAFVMANRQYDENGLPKQDEDEANRADQLLLYEFIQCLVRVAHIKYGALPSLPERFSTLLSRDIMPNAKMDSYELLRAELATPECQEVVARHLPKLREVYRTYAQKQPELPAMKHRLKTIQMREWFALFTELGIIDHKRTTARIVQTSFIQANLVDEATYEDMDLSEFVEGLARVAVERVPVTGEEQPPSLDVVLDDFCKLIFERYYQIYRPPVRKHRPASGAGFHSGSRRARRSRSPRGASPPHQAQMGAGYTKDTPVTDLMGARRPGGTKSPPTGPQSPPPPPQGGFPGLAASLSRQLSPLSLQPLSRRASGASAAGEGAGRPAPTPPPATEAAAAGAAAAARPGSAASQVAGISFGKDLAPP